MLALGFVRHQRCQKHNMNCKWHGQHFSLGATGNKQPLQARGPWNFLGNSGQIYGSLQLSTLPPPLLHLLLKKGVLTTSTVAHLSFSISKFQSNHKSHNPADRPTQQAQLQTCLCIASPAPAAQNCCL